MAAPILVLVAPQDIVNIASAFRIAKNFGIHKVRLVNPEIFDPYRIEGIAHNTADIVARAEIVSSLDDALRDCVFAAVLTGRERAAKRRIARPREAAAELVARGEAGPVAFIAGREDSGLTNDELDRCQLLVTIGTDPVHPSLNLAQAVAIMAHELWVARGGDAVPFKPPRNVAEPATGEQMTELFIDWERALWAIDFFKTRRSEAVMRAFREVMYRTELDGREASLVRAMGIEVVRFLERKGLDVPPRNGPGDEGAEGSGAASPGA